MTVTVPSLDVRRAPDPRRPGGKSVFLAGGITNCPDWQSELIRKIIDRGASGVLYNPRQDEFDFTDPNASENQVRWEHHRLKLSDAIVFWFSRGSPNPIVFYEYGRWGLSGDRPLFVGCDPEFKRRQDVVLQSKFSRPGLRIHDHLGAIADEVTKFLNADHP